MRRGSVSIWLVGALLALAACTPTAPGAATSGTTTPGDSTAVPSQAAPSPQEGPLEALLATAGFGPLGASPEENWEFATALHREREEFLAACMAEQGFEYIPNIQGSPVLIFPDTPPPTGRAFYEQYGFGITVDRLISEQGMLSFNSDPLADPNIPIIQAMSEAEQAAYHLAMNGPFLGDGEIDLNTATGCFWEAIRATGGSIPSEFDGIRAEINTFFNGVTSGLFPEFSQLNAEWRSCMADNGFTGFSTPATAADLLWEEHQAMLVHNPATGMWEMEPAQLAAFSEREFLVATTSYDCQVKVSYEQRYNQIFFALQQVFLDQHRNELEAYVAHFAQMRASEAGE